MKTIANLYIKNMFKFTFIVIVIQFDYSFLKVFSWKDLKFDGMPVVINVISNFHLGSKLNVFCTYGFDVSNTRSK